MDEHTTPTGPEGSDPGMQGGGPPPPEWATSTPEPAWSAGEPPPPPPPPDGGIYAPQPVPVPQRQGSTSTVVIVVVVVGLILCCCISAFGLLWSGVLGDAMDLGELTNVAEPDAAVYEQVSGPTGGSETVAVWMSWDDDTDVDLELWDSSGNAFLGNSAAFGGDDVTSGGAGDEYFEFVDHGSDGDFGSGSFVVSTYFVDGSADETDVTVTVQSADGSVETYTRTVQYLPPYDQWHAFRIDAATGDTEVVDVFYESAGGG